MSWAHAANPSASDVPGTPQLPAVQGGRRSLLSRTSQSDEKDGQLKGQGLWPWEARDVVITQKKRSNPAWGGSGDLEERT